jgi:hypothetical protein
MIVLFFLSALHAQELKITPYGFIKASTTAADHALGSFSSINLSAPTHAVARTRTIDENSRSSFQVAQSRIGATVQKSDTVSGRFELDFIDFNKSSPTTQMVPRVRRAVVTYKGDGWHGDIGQDWDLFSPTGAYSYDIVGLYFTAGNTGFMREQAQYHRDLEDWQLSAAVGMAGSNSTAADSDLETSNSPTYSIRIKRTTGPFVWGYSAIYARINFAATTDRWSEAYGNNIFFEKETATYGLKAELFQGQNLANTAALSLARGTSTRDVREWGGHISGFVALNETNKIFGGAGVDRIDNKGAIAAANISAAGVVNGNATGARHNFLTRVGLEHIIEKDFSWLTELSRFETNNKLSASNYRTEVAHMLETGILWKF